MIEDIPNKLKNIILKREDLIKLGFLEINNQRFLIQWLIKHGFNESFANYQQAYKVMLLCQEIFKQAK